MEYRARAQLAELSEYPLEKSRSRSLPRYTAGFSDRQQTGRFVPSQFTFARWGRPSVAELARGSAQAAKISPGVAFFSTHAKLLSKVVRVLRRSRTVMTDLETKAEKYKSKAARCEEWALQAPVGPQRDLYEVLARYYGELATNFRQVIEKRKAA
jgi:hypothetical protein